MEIETSQPPRSAARFRALFENAGIGIAIADSSGRLLETNAALQNMLGYTAEELRQKNYGEVTHPDDLERECALSQDLLNGNKSELQLEKRYIHRDGHVVWGRLTLTVVGKRGDGEDFAVAMVEDITARKQFENALQHREEELRAVFQSTLDGVAILEPDGVIVDANASACEIMHRQKTDLVGRCLRDFVEIADFDGEWKRFRQKGRYRGQFRLIGSAGPNQTVEISAAVMKNDRGVVVLRDLTERQMLEEQLRQSQKMEAIGRFAGAIAHDFNNVLTIILSYAELLKEDLGNDNPNLPTITNLVAAAHRGAALVGELLFFSKEKTLKASVADLNEIASNFSPLLSRLLTQRIKLSMNLRSEPLPVTVDRIHLEQVLMNLAANARDAMPKQGTLTLSTAEIDFDGTHTDGVNEASGGRFALLQVSDDGMGMDTETKSRIFEPFFTTKGASQGTGLGLATVYGIVKQSGGHISVESAPGSGTTFKLLFPLAAQK
jgi:two-component system cell cycle sensor histidine kinase/response regulator CckA